MSIFEPRTFSTDWEIMVIDRLDRCLSTEQCDAFGGALQAELELPIQVDENTIELALGINTSLEQFWERIRRATDRAAAMVREFDLDLFPAGAHPTERMFNASHIHVGSMHDESGGIYLGNQVMKYIPAFAALAANSPLSRRRRGEFKSYRVQHLAHGCTRPTPVRDPHLGYCTWGEDAAPKLYGAPTMEVRILDCASSRRLLAEMGTLVGAFLHQQGEKVSREPPGREEYRDCLTNRWAAARYGMQATFVWDGQARPVAEILDEMIDDCLPALGRLGAKRTDLATIETMIRKRTCQADFALGLARRYPDPHLLTSAYAKLVRHWDVFDDYLRTSPVLDPAAVPDEDAIIQEHLAHVGEGTHFYQLRGAMYYPPPLTDEIIERMIRKGLITREVTTARGMLLHRIR